MSDCTVSVSLRRVKHLSHYVWLYYISITKKSDTSITMIYHTMSDCTVSVSLRRVIRLSQWFITLCLWPYCISITKKSDTSITVIYHTMSLTTVSVSLRRMIRLSQWFITLCLRLLFSEWYVYRSDLSRYVSDCTVFWVIRLSQWFITLCLWLYCISITKKSDMSITVIYHSMSLTVLYQYH